MINTRRTKLKTTEIQLMRRNGAKRRVKKRLESLINHVVAKRNELY